MTKQIKKAKEPVRIRLKELANGNKSIYLDIYTNGKRRYEFLKLYIVPQRTPFDKAQNENALRAANAIKAQRIIEIANGTAGISDSSKGEMLLSDLLLIYSDKKFEKRKDPHAREGVATLARHLDNFRPGARLKDIDKDFCRDFAAYIKTATVAGGKRISSSSAVTYFSEFNAALNIALKRGLIPMNPVNLLEVEEKPIKEPKQRDYLTIEELKALTATPIAEHIKKPFLFSCFTGLRFGDVRSLTWENIIVEDGVTKVKIGTQKTGKFLILPIPNASDIIPERGTAKDGDFLFRYVSNFWVNKKLNEWSNAAGIKGKKITFHTARHTYATMLLTKGADLYTVSKLLGHTEIRTTQIYAEIIDKKKEEAVNRLEGIL